jgi:hypothetical protein
VNGEAIGDGEGDGADGEAAHPTEALNSIQQTTLDEYCRMV